MDTGHALYRSWCPHCVASRATGQRHVATENPEEETAVPKVMSDYGYMNGDGVGEQTPAAELSGAVDENNLPILVLKDRKSKTLAASFVPEKGGHPFAIKYFSNFLQRLGHREIVNHSDGERSLVLLKRKAAELAGVAAVPEESIVGDSQGNGEIEAAVKEVKGLMRTIKSQLEHNLGITLDRKDPVLSWLPTYAADIISRHRVGSDGCTPHRRLTGKNWNKAGFQFGENRFLKTAMSNQERRRRGSYEMVMVECRYVGHHSRSGAILALTSGGVVRGVGARRLPEESRWGATGWSELKGFPWENKP